MKVYDAAHIKNIAIVGHGGDGKTTLAEAFLANAGLIERRGRVEDGNTTTDYDPEEARRQISLTAAMAPVEWQDVKLNFIDAPGFFDFVGETTQAYYLADSALIVVNGFPAWAWARKRHMSSAKMQANPWPCWSTRWTASTRITIKWWAS